MQNMSRHSWYGALVLVIALWWAAPLPVHAAPVTAAVEFDTIGYSNAGFPFTFGYSFSTSVPFNVDALAYLVDGYGINHQVGLWDSGGTLLVSTTVLNTDPIQGHFQYHSIPTFSLVPGAYTIGGQSPSGNAPLNAGGVVTVSGFTWTGDKWVYAPGGLSYPWQQSNGAGQNGYLAANFSIAVPEPVPLPAALVLFGSGLVGVVGWQRKHQRQSKAV